MSEPISGKNQTLAFDTIEKLNIGEMINSSPTNWTYITGTLNQPLTGLRSVPYGHNILVIGGFTFDIKAVSACDWVYWEHNLSHSTRLRLVVACLLCLFVCGMHCLHFSPR
eukprot:52617_1